MSSKFKPHYHLYAGLIITITIELIPVVTPIAGLTKKSEDNKYNGHEHEKFEIPSLDIGGSSQQQVGSMFLSHTHIEELYGVSASPPGAFTGFITFSPPPLNSEIYLEEELVEYHRKSYFNYFYKRFPKNQNTNLVKMEDYRKFVLDYSNNYGANIYEEFKNYKRLGYRYR